MRSIWSEPILGASLKSECIPCESDNFSIKTMSSSYNEHLWPPQMENDFINLLLQYTGISINWQSIRDEMKKITGRELSETQLFNKYRKSLRGDYKKFSAVLTETGAGWECLASHESWVEYLRQINPEHAQAFNKKGREHYMLLQNLFNQKAAATNSGQKHESDSLTNSRRKHESDSIDSYERSKRVKDSVFSSEGLSLSVEAPNRSCSVIECINVLKTMGLDHKFYVAAVSCLLKDPYKRMAFLASPVKYRKGLLIFYIDNAKENDPRNKENPTNQPP
ncbi:hypothetical protein L1049_028220 [Liquidambar formosana]|uniref:Myb/SANT-like domain-containing protein n=1 Tax=Liquidambar formosana TaxID=63359 RepID=A0AAP0WT67_LIQFO